MKIRHLDWRSLLRLRRCLSLRQCRTCCVASVPAANVALCVVGAPAAYGFSAVAGFHAVAGVLALVEKNNQTFPTISSQIHGP